jgi:hypothetical protein
MSYGETIHTETVSEISTIYDMENVPNTNYVAVNGLDYNIYVIPVMPHHADITQVVFKTAINSMIQFEFFKNSKNMLVSSSDMNLAMIYDFSAFYRCRKDLTADCGDNPLSTGFPSCVTNAVRSNDICRCDFGFYDDNFSNCRPCASGCTNCHWETAGECEEQNLQKYHSENNLD